MDEKEGINILPVVGGGTQMKEEVYWSSSEYAARYSWGANFNDGNVYNYNKYSSYCVRPCTAFKL